MNALSQPERLPLSSKGAISEINASPQKNVGTPLSLACPKCDQKLRLMPEHIGVPGACIRCNTPIIARQNTNGEISIISPTGSILVENSPAVNHVDLLETSQHKSPSTKKLPIVKNSSKPDSSPKKPNYLLRKFVMIPALFIALTIGFVASLTYSIGPNPSDIVARVLGGKEFSVEQEKETSKKIKVSKKQ